MPIDTANPHLTTQSNIWKGHKMNSKYNNERKFFHCTLNDGNIYHITYKAILQDSISLDDHDYDHEFFYQWTTANFYVTCELLSRSLIENILNIEVYGIDPGVNGSNQKDSLSLSQKLSLEKSLKQV